MSKVEFRTSKYVLAHGKAPRGDARGHWAFSIFGDTHFFRGTFRFAKASAAAVAMRQATAGNCGDDYTVVVTVLS